MPALVFRPLLALGWELTLPDTCPLAGVLPLGLIPGFLTLPMDVGLGTLLGASLGAALQHSVMCWERFWHGVFSYHAPAGSICRRHLGECLCFGCHHSISGGVCGGGQRASVVGSCLWGLVEARLENPAVGAGQEVGNRL